jgi:hypothetical protein
MIGSSAAEVLRRRLADLRAVTYLVELPAARPVVIDGDQPQLRFDLGDGWWLSLTVGHRSTPRRPDGVLDETRVRRAVVEGVHR